MNAFFGLVLKPGKGYTVEVDEPFRVSMACLELLKPSSSAKNNGPVLLKVTVRDPESSDSDQEEQEDEQVAVQEVVLCSLTAGKCDQQQLDVIFSEGEVVTLKVVGGGSEDCRVHLSGNYLPPMDFGGDQDGMMFDDLDSDSENEMISGEDDEEIDSDEVDGISEEEEEESDVDEIAAPGKIVPVEEESSAAEEEQVVMTGKVQDNKKRAAPAAEKSVPVSDAKKAKTAAVAEPVKQSKPAAEKPVASAVPVTPTKTTAAAQQAEKPKEKKEQAPGAVNKRTLPSGLIIEDLKLGDGPRAKNGKRIQVRYIGKLKQGGKVFDSNTTGKPFSFMLGKGEVIKGWDLGFQDMQIGGQRRLTIPAQLAYGKGGAAPDIPPNATLIFDVKLLGVK